MPKRSLAKTPVEEVAALYSAGRFREVLAAAKSLIAANPKVPLLHNISGAAYLSLGQSEQAETSMASRMNKTA
jgi:Flp pilus assembly protein TadD